MQLALLDTLTPRQRTILAALREEPGGLLRYELEEETRLSPRVVRRELHQLAQRGLVRRVGDDAGPARSWWWDVTPAGRRMAR